MSDDNGQNWRRRRELPTFEPPGDGTAQPPKTVNTTRHVNNILYVAGQGPRPCRIMFVMPTLCEEDAQEKSSAFNEDFALKQTPKYLKSQAGGMFKNLLEETGFRVSEVYVTAMVKFLLPKGQRNKPKNPAIQWSREAFVNEIKEVKPEIIVCLGKPVFDFLVGLKLNLAEIAGGWFHNEEFDCKVYPTENIERALLKPEFLEKMRVDLLEVKAMQALMDGTAPPKIPQNYRTISNALELDQFVSFLIENNHKTLAVDCEWAGMHHVDGRLRSFQICWQPGFASYIRFMDDKEQYAFDIPYAEAGKILGKWLNRSEVKYVGHQFAADAPWMHHVLGLDIYRKCEWDTLYALHVIDENAEGKLERLAMAKTDMGRYDIELTVWKKQNKIGPDEGYGRIPDSIIITYACRDVDATMRIYLKQVPEVLAQGLPMFQYYKHLFLPFVTDIFSNFTIVGLPMDMHRLDALRELFVLARNKLDTQFREKIVQEARLLFLNKLIEVAPATALVAYSEIEEHVKKGEAEIAFEKLKTAVGPEALPSVLPLYEHYFDSPSFNIRSVDMMRRWLFEVKGFTPIKSTNNKEKGLPSMDWQKVLSMPEASRREIKPSTDKQTLKVLAEKDSLINTLLQLNAVGNLTKAFLREAEIDDDGNVKEDGLHSWVAKDGRIHGQFSATDTGRPRSWKPNSLNWPSWINDQIARAILGLVESEPKDSPIFMAYLRVMGGEENAKDEKGKWKTPPSIRSNVSASAVPAEPGSEGWCFVESDYQTAEVRGLAYIAGDPNLIRLINEPDDQFAYTKDGNLVRIRYAPDYGIDPQHQNTEFLMSYLSKEGGKVTVTEADLVRNPDGSLKHPKHDLHWNLAEFTLHKPREVLHKKKHRDGLGKTGNFKSAYGSSAGGMERAIEAETGVKPDEGTGDAILKSLALRQPIADAFLKEMEMIPTSDNPRIYAASGRIRHLATHAYDATVNQRIRDNVNSSLGRIARNFCMQASVADTAARAALWLNEYYISRGMKARVCMLLYDSVVSLCPVEERHAVSLLHDLFMFRINQWKYHDRILNYPIDTELNWRWSERPSKKDQKKLDGFEWAHNAELYARVKLDYDVMLQLEAPVCVDDRGLWSAIGRGFTFDQKTGALTSGPN